MTKTPPYTCPEFIPNLLTIDEIAKWLNAVISAQTEWDTLTSEEQSWERGRDPADEYWGFFTEWRETLKWAAWDTMD